MTKKVKISKIAILPFNNLNYIPEQAGYGHQLQEEISVRMMLKGYDVVHPEEVNKLIEKERISESQIFAFKKLNETFKLDAVLVGNFKIKIDNYIAVTKGILSYEITFKDPETGRPLMIPFSVKNEQFDLKTISKIDSQSSGQRMSSGIRLTFSTAHTSMQKNPSKEKKIQSIISYIAYSILKNVPQGPKKVAIPTDIVFTKNKIERPDLKYKVYQNCFGLNDTIYLNIITRNPDYIPQKYDRFFAKIDISESEQIMIPLQMKSNKIWTGTYLFSKPGLVTKNAPISIIFEKQGRRFSIGKYALINIKTKKPNLSKLYYTKRSNGLYLVWSRPEQDMTKYEIYKKLKNGEWEKIEEIENPRDNTYHLLPSQFSWGDYYRVRAVDWAGNRADSNSVRLDRNCDKKYDIFYLLSKKGINYTPCVEKFVEDFEIMLKDTFSESGKSCQPSNAYCSEHFLHFLIDPEPTSTGCRIHIKDLNSGTSFFKGKYAYPTGGECWGMAKMDREELDKQIMILIEKLFLENTKNHHPKPPFIEVFCVENAGQVSLEQAENMCRNRKGKLLSFDEWLGNKEQFENKNVIGEYVIGGRVFFDAEKNVWQFEEIFQPLASNPYSVRCGKE